jgi:hypothetical protein
MMTLESTRQRLHDLVASYVMKQIDINKTFKVLKLKSGTTFIETSEIDDEGIETIEFLISTDEGLFRLINRTRSGENHSPMRSYPRDASLPLYSVVRI